MKELPMEEKFAKERAKVLEQVAEGINSNIPLAAVQKKYIKNLLLFAMMSATNNETVAEKNFIKLTNKLFKKFLIKIIQDSTEDDEDDIDENLEVQLNNLLANEQRLDLQALSEALSPKNIIDMIRSTTSNASARLVLKKLLALRDMKSNHRETPEEQKEREKRQKEYEMQRTRERMMDGRVLTRGQHTRS